MANTAEIFLSNDEGEILIQEGEAFVDEDCCEDCETYECSSCEDGDAPRYVYLTFNGTISNSCLAGIQFFIDGVSLPYCCIGSACSVISNQTIELEYSLLHSGISAFACAWHTNLVFICNHFESVGDIVEIVDVLAYLNYNISPEYYFAVVEFEPCLNAQGGGRIWTERSSHFKQLPGTDPPDCLDLDIEDIAFSSWYNEPIRFPGIYSCCGTQAEVEALTFDLSATP